MDENDAAAKLYVGVDVGGTNIVAALAEGCGRIVARQKEPTPARDEPPEVVIATIAAAIEAAMAEGGAAVGDVAAIGLSIPGVVDPEAGRIVITPNMGLSGVEIVPRLRGRIDLPVAFGNDVNLGTLGEKWLGSARSADSAVGVFVGTGIGGGVILDGRLVRGARQSGGEVGHMVMQVGGPVCGCGNRGCFEALASRTAIERDIRAAVEGGAKSIVRDLQGGGGGPIRSKVLRKALAAKDEVVVEVVRRAAQVIGLACLTIRHLLDPEIIVLGGGVMEACGDFIMPIVQEVVASDGLIGAREVGGVVQSSLADDAVPLGAVALARQLLGDDPIRSKRAELPSYPRVKQVEPGRIEVGGKVFDGDFYVTVDGLARKRKGGDPHAIGPKVLRKVCRGGPWVLLVGTGDGASASLTPQAEALLRYQRIEVRAMPTPEAVRAYGKLRTRKAILVHQGP